MVKGEVATMRGRTKGDFEITLFSDLGEAESKKVHKLCNQYGVVKQSTAGYTSEHNAFVERWFRTNAEMSRCRDVRYYSMIHLKLYGRTLGRWQRSSIIGYHQQSEFQGAVDITTSSTVSRQRSCGSYKVTTFWINLLGTSEETDT